jgi:hypothetical protein
MVSERWGNTTGAQKALSPGWSGLQIGSKFRARRSRESAGSLRWRRRSLPLGPRCQRLPRARFQRRGTTRLTGPARQWVEGRYPDDPTRKWVCDTSAAASGFFFPWAERAWRWYGPKVWFQARLDGLLLLIFYFPFLPFPLLFSNFVFLNLILSHKCEYKCKNIRTQHECIFCIYLFIIWPL